MFVDKRRAGLSGSQEYKPDMDALRLSTLPYLSSIRIRRHIQIRSDANPFDPEWDEYFGTRRIRKRFPADWPFLDSPLVVAGLSSTRGRNRKRGQAHRGLALIRKLYRVEGQARKLTPQKRYAHRQNHAENAIRPFVLGRKNWLFSTSIKGVKASANLYSLIETAKANGLEPYVYLRTVFTELPKAMMLDDIEALLPWTRHTSRCQDE